MNKFLLSASTLLLVALMVVSCKKTDPKSIATTWLNGFYHMDYDAAKKVSTEDTKKLLSQLQQFSGMIPDSSKKELKKIVVTVKNVDEKGDNATVTYTTSDNADKEQELKLVKQNDKWLVEFSKNDTMGPGTNDETSPADSTGAAPSDTSMTDTARH